MKEMLKSQADAVLGSCQGISIETAHATDFRDGLKILFEPDTPRSPHLKNQQDGASDKSYSWDGNGGDNDDLPSKRILEQEMCDEERKDDDCPLESASSEEQCFCDAAESIDAKFTWSGTHFPPFDYDERMRLGSKLASLSEPARVRVLEWLRRSICGPPESGNRQALQKVIDGCELPIDPNEGGLLPEKTLQELFGQAVACLTSGSCERFRQVSDRHLTSKK